MAEQNYDNDETVKKLNEFLKEFNPEAAKRFNDSLSKSATKAEDAGRSSAKMASLLEESSRGFNEYERAKKKAKDGVIQFGKDTYAVGLDVSRTLISSSEGFDALKPVVSLATNTIGKLAGAGLSLIPIFGDGLGKAAETAAKVTGELANTIIDQFGNLMKAYQQGSDTGVITSMSNMRDKADILGMKFGETAEVLGKQSSEMAVMFGSATEGADRLASIGGIMKRSGTQEELMRLGYSAKDVVEGSAMYMKQQQMLGNRKNKTDKELAEGSRKYLMELDTLSKQTGLSRKEQENIRDEALRETRFLASMQGLGEKQQKEFERLNTRIRAITGGKDNEIAQGVRDLASGMAGTDAAISLLQKAGGDAANVIQGMKDGTISAEQGMEMLSKAMKKNEQTMIQVGQYNGDQVGISKGLNVALKMARGNFENVAEGMDSAAAQTEATAKGADDMTNNLTETDIKLRDAGRKLEIVATSSESVQKAMNMIAGGMDSLAEKMYELSGQTLPAHMQARKEEREATVELNKEQAKLTEITAEETKIKERLSVYEKRVADTTDERRKKYYQNMLESEKRRAEREQKDIDKRKERQQGKIDEKKKVVDTKHKATVSADEAISSPQTAPEQPKKPTESASSTSTDNQPAGATPQSGAEAKPVDVKPIVRSPLPQNKQIPKAEEGLELDGPMDGFGAILHGREAVVPLGNNLATKPLDINKVVQEIIQKADTGGGAKTQQASSAPNDGERLLIDLMALMSSKFDEMINHAERSVKTSEEQLMNAKA